MALALALVVAGFVGGISAMGAHHALEETLHAPAFVALRAMCAAYERTLEALFVVTSSPIVVPALLLLSALNQRARRAACFAHTKPFADAAERADWVTAFARAKLAWMRTWAWTTVLTFAVYWGMAYVTLQVVISRFTVLFLSWLIDPGCDGLGVYAVTGIILAVGLVMFLLPPVPGMPIYLAGGILITAKGHARFGAPGVIAYCCAVMLALKMLACTVQQKVFGERLGGYVAVRQLCAVNSDTTRVMRLILAEPGLSPPKVAILLGGPDWPTSVLCGILGLPLGSILFGTLPIVVVIVPAVLAGAFMYLPYTWAPTMSTVMATITAA